MPTQPNRKVGVGGDVTYGGTSIVGAAKWGLNSSAELEEVKGQGYVWKERVHVNSEWSADLDLEYLATQKTLTTALAIGSITGVTIESWSLKVTVDIDDPTGQTDEWKVKVATGADVEFESEGWSPTAGYAAFLQAIKDQAEGVGEALPGIPISVVTGFGTFTGLLSEGSVDGDTVLKDKVSVKLSTGGLTNGSDVAGIAALIAEVLAYVADLEAGTTPTAKAFVCPVGTGDAFISSIDLKCPQGHVTGSVKFEGTGAFAPDNGEEA